MKVIKMEPKPKQGTVKETSTTRDQALYSIEAVFYAQLATLQEKAKGAQGLSDKEWKQLKDIMKVISQATDIDLNTTRKSLLEGLSDEEVLELVEQAKRKLADD